MIANNLHQHTGTGARDMHQTVQKLQELKDNELKNELQGLNSNEH